MATHSISDNSRVSRERARLLKVQAELRELELAEKKGDLIPMEQVAQVWERLVSDCRARLISLPSRLAPQVVGCNSISEVKVLIENAIFECLDELATGAGVSRGTQNLQKSSSAKD